MAPFLPFVHTPEQLEGVKAEPGEIGSEPAAFICHSCLSIANAQHSCVPGHPTRFGVVKAQRTPCDCTSRATRFHIRHPPENPPCML